MPVVLPHIAAMTGYVPGEQPRGGDVVKLNTNESPYPPSPMVFEAIREMLTGDRLRKYPEPLGHTFRHTTAEVFGIDPDSILIGNGSDEVLTILTRSFVPFGGVIAAPTPSYILYKSLAEIQCAQFKTVSFNPDWSLPNPWPIHDANLTFIPNPNSPSGTHLSPSVFCDLANRLNGPLVLDEAYADFAPENGLKLAGGNLIVSRTLSKSYALAGIRFGFAVADPVLIREFVKVKDSYNCDVLSLAAATAAVRDQEYLRETCRRMLATRARMETQLRNFGFDVTPSSANFVWCRRTDRPVKPIAERLKERGLMVRYMNYANYGDGLRISVGADHEIDRLFGELEDILKA